MSRWGWHRDGNGFSGGIWPVDDSKPFQLTVLAVYWSGYYLDFCVPVIGDVRLGYCTKFGAANPYSRDRRRIVIDREPWPTAS